MVTMLSYDGICKFMPRTQEETDTTVSDRVVSRLDFKLLIDD